jgi:hypothetical protein
MAALPPHTGTYCRRDRPSSPTQCRCDTMSTVQPSRLGAVDQPVGEEHAEPQSEGAHNFNATK